MCAARHPSLSQVLAVSSAGAVFEQMRDVAPFTLAAWRLQLTSVILMCGALWQWRGMVGVGIAL